MAKTNLFVCKLIISICLLPIALQVTSGSFDGSLCERITEAQNRYNAVILVSEEG